MKQPMRSLEGSVEPLYRRAVFKPRPIAPKPFPALFSNIGDLTAFLVPVDLIHSSTILA